MNPRFGESQILGVKFLEMKTEVGTNPDISRKDHQQS